MIKQALATIEHGAVGNHAMGIHAALQNAEIDTAMFAETIRPDFRSLVQDIGEFASHLQTEDTVLYQFANPSPMADLLYEKPCRLIVNYHNVTPAHYFARWFPSTAAAISRARTQLARLSSVASAAIAVSEFNAEELISLGYRNVEVIPPIFSDTFYQEKQLIQKDQHIPSWLYVGRIAPHKNIHVLIHALDIYRRYYDSRAVLTIVGSCDTPLYGKAVDELIDKRGLTDAVVFSSGVNLDALVEYYQSSTVYVSASEHEGFCVPLIEAMALGLPVIAVNAAAVGDTTGSAAKLVAHPDPFAIAENVAKLMGDPDEVKKLQNRGYIRSEKFNPKVTQQAYVDYLSEWLS